MERFFNNIFINFDAEKPWMLHLEDTDDPLVQLHDNIMFYSVILLFAVAWILLSITRNYIQNKSLISNKYLNRGTLIELILKMTPGFILTFIAFTFLKLVYLTDEVTDLSNVSVKVNQSYLLYQYPDFFNIYNEKFVPWSDLETDVRSANTDGYLSAFDYQKSTGSGYDPSSSAHKVYYPSESNTVLHMDKSPDDPMEGSSTNPEGTKRTATDADLGESGEERNTSYRRITSERISVKPTGTKGFTEVESVFFEKTLNYYDKAGSVTNDIQRILSQDHADRSPSLRSVTNEQNTNMLNNSVIARAEGDVGGRDNPFITSNPLERYRHVIYTSNNELFKSVKGESWLTPQDLDRIANIETSHAESKGLLNELDQLKKDLSKKIDEGKTDLHGNNIPKNDQDGGKD